MDGDPEAAGHRWLVRFGYDGADFAGWARQPRLPTVEGTVRDGIRSRRVVPPGAPVRVEVASRTDRGVSARANVLALGSGLGAAELLHRLNAISPKLMFTAATEAPAGFRVRRALRRVYRYFDPRPLERSSLAFRAGELLVGSVDARSFGRGFPAASPHWTTLESLHLRPEPGGLMIEVTAPAFVWGMVRKIVGALREVDAGRLSLERLEAAARGRSRLTLPLAEPEGLVLWDVEYPLRWEFRWAGPARLQERYLTGARKELWRRSRVLAALSGDRAE